MNPSVIIGRKRDGGELSAEEIAWFIGGFANDQIPNYQMAALAMAIYLRGMTAEETAALTRAMWHSGVTMSWPAGHRPIVDKHSTGGIGDKTSLTLAPLLACCGLQVPMISGRGLGPTGGTLDKLESTPGFRTDLSVDELQHVVNSVGCAITGASEEIAPADRKLYALRDVTATVASIPLITASIMSKKLAEGLDCLVLDVKFGSGAFMKSLDDARRLARSLVDTGKHVGVRTTALLTDMNQPLGRMIGNAVEVDESVEVLAGRGPADLIDVTLALGVELLRSANIETDPAAAGRRLRDHLQSGAALAKFREMVTAQGGDLDRPRRRAVVREIAAPSSGFVTRIDNEQLGLAVIEMGGGRRFVGQAIDHSVGLEMLVRIGDQVQKDQPLAHLFCPAERAEAAKLVVDSIHIGSEQVEPLPLVVERMGASD